MLAHHAAATSAVLLIVLAVAALGVEVGRAAALWGQLRGFLEEGDALDDERRRQFREEEAVNRLAVQLINGTVPLSAAVDQVEPVLRHRTGFEHEYRNDPPRFATGSRGTSSTGRCSTWTATRTGARWFSLTSSTHTLCSGDDPARG